MSCSQDPQDPQTVDLSALILGFSSAALYYTGHENLDGKPIQEANLKLADQNLQIIEMLREKTKGNLSPEELSLMDSVIADLHEKIRPPETGEVTGQVTGEAT